MLLGVLARQKYVKLGTLTMQNVLNIYLRQCVIKYHAFQT